MYTIIGKNKDSFNSIRFYFINFDMAMLLVVYEFKIGMYTFLMISSFYPYEIHLFASSNIFYLQLYRQILVLLLQVYFG